LEFSKLAYIFGFMDLNLEVFKINWELYHFWVISHLNFNQRICF